MIISLFVGSIELWVSDGQLGSSRHTVPVVVTSTFPPQIMTRPLLVNQGQKAVIKSAKHLSIQDEDTAQIVVVKVKQGNYMFYLFIYCLI